MQAEGLTGSIEFYRPDVSYPSGLIVRDLEKAARLRVVEGENAAPAVRKWRPLQKMGDTGAT
jgi:hypothetical protein